MVHGLCVTLQFDTGRAKRDLAESYVAEVRNRLRRSRILYTGLRASEKGVEVAIKSDHDLDEATRLLEGLNYPVPGARGDSLRIVRDGRHFVLVPTQPAIDDRLNAATLSAKERWASMWKRPGRSFEVTIFPYVPGRLGLRIEGAERFEQEKARRKRTIYSWVHLNIALMPPPLEPVSPDTPAPPGDKVVRDWKDRLKNYLVSKRGVLSGESLVNVTPVRMPDGAPVIRVQFDARGAHRLMALTGDNVGSGLAFMLDDWLLGIYEIHHMIANGVLNLPVNAAEDDLDTLVGMIRGTMACCYEPIVIEERPCSWPSTD